MGFKLKINSEDFERAIERNRKGVKREMRKALKTVGIIVEAEAKRNCPREGWPLQTKSRYKVTGELRRTIRSKVASYKKVRIIAGGTGKTNYAKWVHEGTPLMVERPFLKRGLIYKKRDVQVVLKNAVYKSMELD